MTDISPRLTAALADRYTIERELGAGGMATVYLAEDLKHHRRVAVKVLRPELAAVLGAERFVQEIETTANLQHPHILPLFDSGEAEGFLYYVMPFIDGESLREKLNRETQLGIDEAVKIATEVADALDYAHRHNVIHRDIKPENILLQDGRPMVADFGIALAVSAAAGGRMTETGLSLGTPHYMSPEQATAEKDLTNRSDIYSLGSVLYEMLTGSPPHVGSSAQQIIMKIVAEDVQPVTELRKSVPPNVAAATAKALEKLPADRFGSAAQFAEALGNPAFARPSTPGLVAGAAAQDVAKWKRLAVGSVAAAVVAAVIAVWSLIPSDSPAQVLRVSVRLPEEERLVDGPLRDFDIAPDGGRFAYIGPGDAGGTLIWVRDLSQLTATPLRGTENACCPVFSPDGERIAYITLPDLDLTVIDADGGPPTTLQAEGHYELFPREDLAWGVDGYIYASAGAPRSLQGSGTIHRIAVDASSEGWEQLTVLDSASAEDRHRSPRALPNGKGVLFTISYGSATTPSIGVLDLETLTHRALATGSAPQYAASGHVIYADFDGSLVAVPFDQKRLEITGSSVPLGGSVTNIPLEGSRELSVAWNGTALFATGERGIESVVWVDRAGVAEAIDSAWAGNFETLALSPDGRRLAVSIEEGGDHQLWIRTLSTSAMSKFTIEGGRNFRPFWRRGGEELLFVSDRDPGGHNLYRRRVDGGIGLLVLDLEREVWEGEWSPDGQWLIYRTGVPPTRDLFVKHSHPDSVGRTISASDAFQEVMPTLSPNGLWLAYRSDETGRDEIYVRPFPNIDDDKRTVSDGGGTEPVWSRDGTELFYKNTNRELVSVGVDTRAGFSIRGREVLFSVAEYQAGDEFCCHPTYDVDLDGQRFVMIKRSGGTSELVLVQGLLEELRE